MSRRAFQPTTTAARARALAIIRACARAGRHELMENFVGNPAMTVAAVNDALRKLPPVVGRPRPAQSAPDTMNPRERAIAIIHACTKAGAPELAEAYITSPGMTLDMVNDHLAIIEKRQQFAAERARCIRIICAWAGLPDLAPGFIQSLGFDLAAVKAQLCVITAKIDNVEIDGSLEPRGSGSNSLTGIYRRRSGGVQ